MTRRAWEAALLLIVASNVWHLVVAGCRYYMSRRYGIRRRQMNHFEGSR